MSCKPLPPCPRCQGVEFHHIPDSLAFFCKACGFVWIGYGDDVQEGVSIQEWVEDVYGQANEPKLTEAEEEEARRLFAEFEQDVANGTVAGLDPYAD